MIGESGPLDKPVRFLGLSVAAWELGAASALLVVRILQRILQKDPPPPDLWRDWVSLLAVYWMFTVAAGRTRAWPRLTFGLCASLLLVYLVGQSPLSIESIRWGLFP
jgi:hypothetical protein